MCQEMLLQPAPKQIPVCPPTLTCTILCPRYLPTSPLVVELFPLEDYERRQGLSRATATTKNSDLALETRTAIANFPLAFHRNNFWWFWIQGEPTLVHVVSAFRVILQTIFFNAILEKIKIIRQILPGHSIHSHVPSSIAASVMPRLRLFPSTIQSSMHFRSM